MSLQQKSAVPTATKSRIDQNALLAGQLFSGLQHRIGQHGHMAEGGHKAQTKTP